MATQQHEAECATLWYAHFSSPVATSRDMHTYPLLRTSSDHACDPDAHLLLSQIGNRCVGLYRKGTHKPLYSSLVCSLPYHNYMQVRHPRSTTECSLCSM